MISEEANGDHIRMRYLLCIIDEVIPDTISPPYVPPLALFAPRHAGQTLVPLP